jgi:hypothetical protein
MSRCIPALVLLAAARGGAMADDLGEVPLYHVLEVTFDGPQQGPSDVPARDVALAATFRHEGGEQAEAFGFWDGDGQGGVLGSVFKVRFCPTQTGRWTISQTASNRPELARERVGDVLTCVPSEHHGSWVADGRWYRRTDGTHQYIMGNTHYTFLSRRNDRGPVETAPVEDVRANAKFYRKLRFALTGCRYPDPDVKPFLDDSGQPTDDGRYSLRPNPRWFHERADPVVREGFAQDLICDLILCGPDTREARSTLRGESEAWLRYVAARYGAYPNVWFCLCNEWNIKQPSYTTEEIVRAGETLRRHLPFANPVSVHSNTGNWNTDLNGDWHDHTIIQWKLKTIAGAADAAARNIERGGGKPVVNDENAYEGDGDRFSEGDTIEGCLGTFLGGGYPTTGEKYGNKLGQYFWGGFDPQRHKASDNLKVLRWYADEHTSFWRMRPNALQGSPFENVPGEFRLLAAEGREYILGSNAASHTEITLPDGQWQIAQVDLMAKVVRVKARGATGTFRLETPDSRAALTHFKRVD